MSDGVYWSLGFVALFLVCVLILAVCAWHERNFRRIPRAKLVEHRITVRLPLGDWK